MQSDAALQLRELARNAVILDAQPRTSVLEAFECPEGFEWWPVWEAELEAAENENADPDLSWLTRSAKAVPEKAPPLSQAEREFIEDVAYSLERIPPIRMDEDGRAFVNREIRDWAAANGLKSTVRLAKAAYARLGLEWRSA